MSNHDLIERNELSQNSKGGTELLQERLYDGSVPRELLEQFQIVFSRVRNLDESRYRIFYTHDLPGDPESHFLANGGWAKFHKLIFVSNWQMQAYINAYRIPWSHCEVIENSIYPIEPKKKSNDVIRFCYTSTPHRGLNIAFAAFKKLTETHDNIEFDVFSSFKLYGWDQRDAEYQELLDAIKEHPKTNYHGTVSNEEIRDYLATQGHIFVHPSTWPETSCLCLIEAMSAGLMCIHSNFAALPDTAGGMTYMYQMDEDENRHASKLYALLKGALEHYQEEYTKSKCDLLRVYANNRFNWNVKALTWNGVLSQIAARKPSKAIQDVFIYEG